MSKRRTYPKMQTCATVGELVEQLQRLPASMLVNPLDDGVLPVVFNAGRHDEHVSIEDNDGTWNDEREDYDEAEDDAP